jgi:hypothetical protein
MAPFVAVARTFAAHAVRRIRERRDAKSVASRNTTRAATDAGDGVGTRRSPCPKRSEQNQEESDEPQFLCRCGRPRLHARAARRQIGAGLERAGRGRRRTGDRRCRADAVHNDGDQLAPMVARTTETLREAGIEEPIGVVLADGGYWHSSAISGVRKQGIDVLILTRTANGRSHADWRPSKARKRSESKRSSPEDQRASAGRSTRRRHTNPRSETLCNSLRKRGFHRGARI